MYILRIHTVDIPEPYYSASTSVVSATAITSLTCQVRLLRSTAVGSIASPSCRSTTIFVAAVPNYVSTDDFILCCGSHFENFIELRFFRNDGMEDRYSVLITFANQLTADEFYYIYNGKRFQSFEGEVCHLYFIQSFHCFEYIEEARVVPPGYVDLPTCPVCLERLDQDTSGIQTTLCDHSSQCSCAMKWTYLSCPVCRLCRQQDEKLSCVMCGTLENPWVCMICGFIGCGRYQNRHAMEHWKYTQHCYVLELEDRQIWDYTQHCYVHRLHQGKIDGKSLTNKSSCMSHKDGCGTCGCSEDSSICLDSKVEAIMDEYNHLLATPMETQRQSIQPSSPTIELQKTNGAAFRGPQPANTFSQEIRSNSKSPQAEVDEVTNFLAYLDNFDPLEGSTSPVRPALPANILWQVLTLSYIQLKELTSAHADELGASIKALLSSDSPVLSHERNVLQGFLSELSIMSTRIHGIRAEAALANSKFTNLEGLKAELDKDSRFIKEEHAGIMEMRRNILNIEAQLEALRKEETARSQRLLERKQGTIQLSAKLRAEALEAQRLKQQVVVNESEMAVFSVKWENFKNFLRKL